MLGKLIKHEWKRVYKIESILVLVLVAVSLLGAILFHTPMGTAIFSNTNEYMSDEAVMIMTIWVMTFVTSVMVYIVMVIGVTYGNLIFQGYNFYKTMYTDEGYLTHTLPVKPHQLLGSKFIVGILWTLIIHIAMFLSIGMMIFSLMLAINPEMFQSFSTFQTAVLEELDFVSMTSAELGVMVHMGLVYVAILIMGPISSISMIFGAMTIGQLVNKHKAIMGIACYFGLTFVNQILATLCQIVGMVGQVGTMAIAEEDVIVNMHSQIFFSYDLQIIMMLLLSIALYFLSHFIISKKLNLN
ncbi:MAG: hypothetical protein II994_02505 [Lachnospiraceae bacterium]|nr:hypothetical protein [Lachnospiraceae bacterium]